MNTPEKKGANQNYDAVLSVRNNKYYLYISELQLVASGDTLDSAYKQLNTKREERIKEFSEAGFLAKLPPPGQNSPNQEISIKRKETGIFVIKSLVVTFMFIMVIVFAGNTLSKIAVSYPQKVKTALQNLPQQFLREMEYELHNAAKIELSPTRQEKIKTSIRAVARQIKPYLDELSLTLLKPKKNESVSEQ